VRNSVFWANQSDIGIGADMYFEDNGAPIRISFCCFSNLSYQTGSGLVLSSNTMADPLLTSDLHLRAGSPCIDAGTNLAWMTGAKDLSGQPRIFNSRVDMDLAGFVSGQSGEHGDAGLFASFRGSGRILEFQPVSCVGGKG
jgi:hypothetical protein